MHATHHRQNKTSYKSPPRAHESPPSARPALQQRTARIGRPVHTSLLSSGHRSSPASSARTATQVSSPYERQASCEARSRSTEIWQRTSHASPHLLPCPTHVGTTRNTLRLLLLLLSLTRLSALDTHPRRQVLPTAARPQSSCSVVCRRRHHNPPQGRAVTMPPSSARAHARVRVCCGRACAGKALACPTARARVEHHQARHRAALASFGLSHCSAHDPHSGARILSRLPQEAARPDALSPPERAPRRSLPSSSASLVLSPPSLSDLSRSTFGLDLSAHPR